MGIDYLKWIKKSSNKNDAIIGHADYIFVHDVLIFRWQLDIIQCLSKQCLFYPFLKNLWDFMFDSDMEGCNKFGIGGM